MRRLLYELRHALASPSRHPRMAVVLGRLLGSAFLICFITGLYSHFIQNPLPWMVFPTVIPDLYAITQGLHIAAGIACFPLLLGKLYTIYPRLFTYPLIKGPLNLAERGSIALFVAASLVEIVIGMINTSDWYPFPFPFRQTHFVLAFVIIGSLAIHIGVKLPLIAQYWTKNGWVTNGGDSTSSIAAGASPLTTCSAGMAYPGALAAPTPSPVQLQGGTSTIWLPAPGAGKTGCVAVTMNGSLPYLPSTTGTAVFGVYKSRLIYLREVY